MYRGIYYIGLNEIGDGSLWLTKAILIVMALPMGLVAARLCTDKNFRHCTWGNTAQRASGDFARHLLANFPSEPVSYLLARILRAYFPRYFGKILENPQRIFSVFPFISQKIWRRNLHTSDTKQTLIFHKNAREYIKYSLRFLFHLTKNLTTNLSHNLCAVLP